MDDKHTFQVPKQQGSSEGGDAASVIRQKLANIYAEEPNAGEEALQVVGIGHTAPLSKHQKYIAELTQSKRSLADIQSEWHDYYMRLPDYEKHEVWQEFYTAHAHASKHPLGSQKPQPHEKANESPTGNAHISHNTAALKQRKTSRPKTVAELKRSVTSSVTGSKQLKPKHHLQSMLFGLGLGGFVLLVFLFGFFNERFIAPFITPSRVVTNTPIIADSSSAIGPEPKIIIPKINVEIPVVYDEPSVNEDAVQNALERGVVHYANTSAPGEQGNSVIVGHSSNNIFNQGAYKFAFVLLNRMESGDTFMLHKDGKRYTYRVFDKKIVKPTEVGVLNATSKPATATLITCDPPGTSINRLVVVGEQISPSPATNVASTVKPTLATTQPSVIPGNAPSLWNRLFGWLDD